MPKSYSIAEARNDLPALIHEVERGDPVKITRHGKAVAVILSAEEYARIAPSRPSFPEAYEAWRRSVDLEQIAVTAEHFTSLRDRSPGRPVKL